VLWIPQILLNVLLFSSRLNYNGSINISMKVIVIGAGTRNFYHFKKTY
jgi:hypothetical protein